MTRPLFFLFCSAVLASPFIGSLAHAQPAHAQPAHAQPGPAQPTHVHAQPTVAQPTHADAVDPENWAADIRAADSRAADNRTADNRAAETPNALSGRRSIAAARPTDIAPVPFDRASVSRPVVALAPSHPLFLSATHLPGHSPVPTPAVALRLGSRSPTLPSHWSASPHTTLPHTTLPQNRYAMADATDRGSPGRSGRTLLVVALGTLTAAGVATAILLLGDNEGSDTPPIAAPPGRP